MAAALLAAGCRPAADPEAGAVAVEPVLRCGDAGGLNTELYGAVQAQVRWDRNELECSGMPRPEGAGVRLRFAGLAGPDHPVAFIIAIPGFARDTADREFSSNVTFIEEGAGRFFSTPDLDNCLASIDSLTALDEAGEEFAIAGALWCVAPLPEVNGSSSVSIPELQFTGLLDWGAS